MMNDNRKVDSSGSSCKSAIQKDQTGLYMAEDHVMRLNQSTRSITQLLWRLGASSMHCSQHGPTCCNNYIPGLLLRHVSEFEIPVTKNGRYEHEIIVDNWICLSILYIGLHICQPSTPRGTPREPGRRSLARRWKQLQQSIPVWCTPQELLVDSSLNAKDMSIEVSFTTGADVSM